MKKFFLLFLTIIFLLLITEGLVSNDSKNTKESSNTIQPKFIILDSVDDDFFERENITYMEEVGKPAPIPNAELRKPIVITKMPLTNNTDPSTSENVEN